MILPEIIEGRIDEGTDNWLLGRIVDHLGGNVQRADWTAWNLQVTNERNGSIAYQALAQPSSDTAYFFWYDTLQKTGEWDGKDNKGFNFRLNLRDPDVVAWASDNLGLLGGESYIAEFGFASAATHGLLTAKFRLIVDTSVSFV